ncbi:MAG: O-antigen ligase family protein [Phycisphaerae bacterium]|nr:O-antigen ligase family protein [Phycisphaerae bacterium]
MTARELTPEVVESPTLRIGSVLETVSLFVLLTVIGLRPLISETYDLAGLAMTSALQGVTDPLPLHTLLIDLVILSAIFVWAVGRGLQSRRRYWWCGLEAGLGLVVVAAIVSCVVAGNRRVAINASVDWVCMALITVVLAQLLRQRRRIRLTLCVLVASAAAQAYQCFDQVLIGFAETERMYLENRESFWQAQGVPLDSSRVRQFERRLQSREAYGYLSHSNVTGGYLLLPFFAALGMAAGRWRRWAAAGEYLPVVMLAAVVLLLLAALLLTHSIGAMVACAAGLALWAIRGAAWRWIDSHRLQALALGWGLVVGGGLAVVWHGVSHESLPGTSLSFRWGYWTTSAELISEHRWTGVGRENFGDAYLKHKTIAEPEEISNPHNFLVGAAADWGVVGLVGVVAMAVGGSIVVTRRMSGVTWGTTESKAALAVDGYWWLWMLLLGLSIFGVRLGLLSVDDPSFLLVETVLPGLVWLTVFAICVWGPDPWESAGRAGWLRMGVVINCGLFAFLLQDTINFALIVPGAATTFFAMVGVAVAARRVGQPGEEPDDETVCVGWRRWRLAIAAGLGLVVVVGAALVPVWRATGLVVAAREQRDAAVAGEIEHHPTNLLYEAAQQADPLDPTAAAERAEWLKAVAASSSDSVVVLRSALASIEEAIARCPQHIAYHRRRAMILFSLARLTDDPLDRAGALESAERALELYPSRPASYVDLANLEVWAGRAEGRAELVRSGVKHYQKALDLDAQRPVWEEVRRLSSAQVELIRRNIATAQDWLGVGGPWL